MKTVTTITTTTKPENPMDERIYSAVHNVPFAAMLELLEVDTAGYDESAVRHDMSVHGIDTDTIKNADVLKALAVARDAMADSDDSACKVAYTLGLIKASRSYMDIDTPDGKRKIRNFKEFCAAFLPEWAYVTLSLYADVGTYIYIPAAAGMPEYECLKDISKLTPSRIKNLVPVCKDVNRFSRLPALIPGDKETFTKSEIEQIARDTKPTKPRPTEGTKDGDSGTETAESHDSENLQAFNPVELAKLFMSGSTEEGEVQILVTDKEKAIFTLTNISKSPDASKAFVEWLTKAIRNA